MAASYGSGGPLGATQADHQAARDLTTALVSQLSADGRSKSSIAAAAGVSPSTISGWTTRGAMPRLGHLAAVGLEVGWRLQWRPPDATWPGMAETSTTEKPEPQSWWGGGAWRRRLPGVASSEVTPAYLAALLGAEVRWWRLAVARRPLEGVPGVNMKTWADFENGPEREWIQREKPRLVKSAPLTTAIYIGRQAGLELEWASVGDRWRVPPWVVAGPPKRVRTSKPRPALRAR